MSESVPPCTATPVANRAILLWTLGELKEVPRVKLDTG